MPREPRARRVPVIPSNSLVASATRFTGGQTEQIYIPPAPWQHECYRHFDICGEARFAARFFGNAMSRAVLKVGKMQRGGTVKETTGGPARQYLDGLFNGGIGQSQMLAAIGVHLTVAGECWLFGRNMGGVDYWEVVSVQELNVRGTRRTIDYGDGKPPIEVADSDVLIRVWLPHPARRAEADSPFRSLLPVLSEIEYLTKHIFAQTRSRLASAGIFAIPSETTFPTAPPTVDGKVTGTTNDLDAFMRMLATAMSASVTNQGSPESLVPIFMKMPGEHIQHLRLLEFWSKLDENAMTMRDADVRRFFLGMDLPPEAMAGMSSNPGTGGGSSNGVSHWGAWQIEEQTIKMHIEPALDMVTNAVTLAFLRPLTNDDNDVVYFDTSALRLRPDRSEQAMALNNMGILKDDVTARENGFAPEEMMSDDDLRKWTLRKIIAGQTSAPPEQVIGALNALGIILPAVPTPNTATPGTPASDQPRGARPAPSLDRLPDRPRTPEPAALLPVAEALVLQALGRAGNRIRSKFDVRVAGVPAYSMHTLHRCNGVAAELLEDAFPTGALVLDDQADTVLPVLHAYCRSLMANSEPHTRDRLADFLQAAGC